ncbi:MAG TPA: DUF4349 domain-containing protein, partial [Pyrinomonadaceae bacterium]|nr:DUF4349 domain-containing protein [Pyrinomonadaceae bacterium]
TNVQPPSLPEQSTKQKTRVWLWPVAVALAVLMLSFAIVQPKIARRQLWNAAQRPAAMAQRAPEAPVDLVRTKNPMIARTARLIMSTRQFDQARADLEQILKKHEGYFAELQLNAPAIGNRTLDATLRVRSDQMEAALADIRKLGRVEAESLAGEDETQQYVDLEARLINARRTEERLAAMLRERTGKLTDVLVVEKEIARVRGEIEQMEAESKSLLNKVSFARVHLTLAEEAEVRIMPESTLTRFHNAALAGYRAMAGSIVGVISFLLASGPSLVLWGAIAFFPARWLWKRMK